MPYLTLTLNIPHIHSSPGAICIWGIFRVRVRPPRLRVLVPSPGIGIWHRIEMDATDDVNTDAKYGTLKFAPISFCAINR